MPKPLKKNTLLGFGPLTGEVSVKVSKDPEKEKIQSKEEAEPEPKNPEEDKQEKIEQKKKEIEKREKIRMFRERLDKIELSKNQWKILDFLYRETFYNVYPLSVFTISNFCKLQESEVNATIGELLKLNYIIQDDGFSEPHYKLSGVFK